MIPSNIIERIMVYKTGSPDLPGDFSGGLAKIETKKFVDSNFTSVNYSIRYNYNTTFRKLLYEKNFELFGFTEQFGFSNGSRNLPDDFPNDLNKVNNTQAANYGKKLKNKWKIDKKYASPDQSLNITVGRIINNKIVSLTSMSYSNSKQHYYSNIFNYNSYNLITQLSDTIYKYNDDIYSIKNNLLFMQNITYTITPKNIIEFKNLINQNNNQIIERKGINFEEGFYVNNYSFNYQERTLLNSQINGEHNFGNSIIFWNVFYSHTINNQPDYRRIRSVKNIDNENNNTFQIVIAPSASTLDAGRFFSKLNENNKGVNVDYKFDLYENNKTNLIFKCGSGIEIKNREFNARWISYKKANSSKFDNTLLYLPISEVFDGNNLNDSTGFIITEGTNPSDRYIAENKLYSLYFSLSSKLYDKLQIVFGIRSEYNIQSLYSRNYSNKAVTIENPIMSFLPSINVSYNFNDKKLMRFSYFKSINRPEFREIAPFSYYDFQYNNVLIGNENIKDAFIYNIDFRYEVYPNKNEIFNIGLFYKIFKNPIEMYYIPGTGSGGTINFTYLNAPSAYNLGIETEIRKSLCNIFKNNKMLEQTGILLNASYV